MKKIILSFIVSVLVSSWVSANGLIDLNKCSVYYDGCNTCNVRDGKLMECTEMFCLEKDTAMCKEFIEEVKVPTNELEFCVYIWGWYNPSTKECNIDNQSINAGGIFWIYKDIKGEMMYLWGSKYFDERLGSYNLWLVQNDYHLYLFIKNNVPSLYKQYQKEIDAQIKSLWDKLNIDSSLQEKYEVILGEKSIEKLDTITNKLLQKTQGKTHIEKERYLIKKVQLLEWLRNKYQEKNTSGRYDLVLHIIDYLYQSIEKNIAYE